MNEQGYGDQPLIVANKNLDLPEGQRWILEEEMIDTDSKGMPIPMLRVGTVTTVFFGRKSNWFYYLTAPREIKGYDENKTAIRGRSESNWLTLDGEPLEFRRDEGNNRYLSLADVERLAHAVAQNRRIDGAELQRVLLMVKTCAQQYGIIP